MTTILEQLPPNDPVAERAFIGSILLDGGQMDRVVGTIRPEDFYLGRNRRLFELMLAQYDRDGMVDPVTVRSMLTPDELREVDEENYLARAVITGRDAPDARSNAAIVVERAKQRALMNLTYEITRYVQGGRDSKSVLELVREHCAGLERQEGREPETVESLLESAFAEIAGSKRNTGYSSGWPALDSLIGGFEPGQMIVIGGRPSMGKSALALCLALNLSGSRIPVGYLSFEMTKRQLVRRAVACVSGISTNRLKGGELLEEYEIQRLNEGRATLKHSPLTIDDTEGCSPEVMRARGRRLVEKFGAKVLIVDHLHLMRAPERDRTVRSQTDSMTLISHAVKAMAVELAVPVLAVCQLNREAAKANKREDNEKDKAKPPPIFKPTLTDLRDSGALEQDADVVMLIHRDGYYTKDKGDKTAEIIVAKNRDGDVDNVKLCWRAECQRFDAVGF